MKQRSVGIFLVHNKMKSKKYNTVGRVSKLNIIVVERGKVDTPTTQIHDRSLSLLCTGTSIKGGGVKRVKWTQISTLREMIVHARAFHMWENCQLSHITGWTSLLKRTLKSWTDTDTVTDILFTNHSAHCWAEYDIIFWDTEIAIMHNISFTNGSRWLQSLFKF